MDFQRPELAVLLIPGMVEYVIAIALRFINAYAKTVFIRLKSRLKYK